MQNNRLKPSERISSDSRFSAIRKSGLKAGDRILFLRGLANGKTHPRLGLAVSKKSGGSVTRTHLRRMLREAFRLNKSQLPTGLDLLVSPRRGASEASLENISASLLNLSKQIKAKIERLSEKIPSSELSPTDSAEDDEDAPSLSIPVRAACLMIRGYQLTLGKLLGAFGPVCRFQPTCSRYTMAAIKRHGFLRGCLLGFWRILRCNPLCRGGHDPVPERKSPKRS